MFAYVLDHFKAHNYVEQFSACKGNGTGRSAYEFKSGAAVFLLCPPDCLAAHVNPDEISRHLGEDAGPVTLARAQLQYLSASAEFRSEIVALQMFVMR